MFDLIQDRSVGEVHDIIRQTIAKRHEEGSIPIRIFDTSVELFLEEGDDVGLESFLQLLWDEMDAD